MRAMSLHIGPPRMSGRSVSEPHSSFASQSTLPVFLPPVTDNMLFLSQRKGKHLHQICFGREGRSWDQWNKKIRYRLSYRGRIPVKL